jgi:hypothetical protein
MNFEELKEQAILFIYWCNKLREGEFLEGGPVITEKGFDIALDLIESGVKLTEENALKCCKELDTDPVVIDLIMEMQEIGYVEFLKLYEKLEGMSEGDIIRETVDKVTKEE